MTVFWSELDETDEWWPVATLEQEEAYWSTPVAKGAAKALDPKQLTDITSPGVAEVTALKAHLVRKAHNTLAKVKTPEDRIIVCYRPAGATAEWGDSERMSAARNAVAIARSTADPTTAARAIIATMTAAKAKVDVFATRFDSTRTGQTASYRTGPWWYLGVARVPVLQSIRPVDGSIFGTVNETPVRTLFGGWLYGKYKHKVTNMPKRADAKKSDITWETAAEMYAELARTTHDEFLAELANELATLG